MNFFNSKLLEELGQGKLPEVQTKVAIDPATLLKLAGTLIVVAVIIVLVINIVKKI